MPNNNPNDATNTSTDKTESPTPAPSEHTTCSTFIDADGVTGIYYDAGSGSFVRVLHRNSNCIAVYAGLPQDSTPDETPIGEYTSETAFYEAEPDLHVVPDRAITNPVSVAEEVYSTGFTSVMEDAGLGTDIAVLYADGVTTITQQYNDEND